MPDGTLAQTAQPIEDAVRRGRELKIAGASRTWFEEAARAGAGELDYSAVVATILDH